MYPGERRVAQRGEPRPPSDGNGFYARLQAVRPYDQLLVDFKKYAGTSDHIYNEELKELFGIKLGETLKNHAQQTKQALGLVLGRFVLDYRPSLFEGSLVSDSNRIDHASIIGGEVTIDPHHIYMATVTMLRAFPGSVSTFLYRSLGMTPESARKIFQKLWGHQDDSHYEFSAQEERHMEQIELAELLPPGTIRTPAPQKPQ